MKALKSLSLVFLLSGAATAIFYGVYGSLSTRESAQPILVLTIKWKDTAVFTPEFADVAGNIGGYSIDGLHEKSPSLRQLAQAQKDLEILRHIIALTERTVESEFKVISLEDLRSLTGNAGNDWKLLELSPELIWANFEITRNGSSSTVSIYMDTPGTETTWSEFTRCDMFVGYANLCEGDLEIRNISGQNLSQLIAQATR